MKQGRLYLNDQGRYRIKCIKHYFSSGDLIELLDEETLEWMVGRIEHHSTYGDYAIVNVVGWCGVISKEEIYHLDNWIAKGI